MPGEPEQSRVEKVLQAFGDAGREARQVQEAGRIHRDTMLTWAIGLMGGGVFAVVQLGGGPCSGLGFRPLIWAASPWVAGVLLAVVGRMANAAQSQAASIFAVQEGFQIRSALARGLNTESASK